ncbi:DNA polymerase I [Candidatus Berkelbacteria bacterium]|nr:DNA polymerase I [Candidatus Berkelbacteria bacterium]
MAKPLPKILLLDSNALIHRSFHALPPLATPKGEIVNAVFGFASTLLKAIKDENPDYVVACFDTSKETFRSDIYKEYKAHRKETDHALVLQIPRVKQIVEVLNIPLFAQDGVEADDLIGSLANIAAKKGIEAVIVTGDNDALQLVNNSVKVYSLRRGVTDTLTYDAAAVKEKIGVLPEQIIDYKALAGDASDNIPGAPGIGPKTAVELLNKYQNLDGIYQHLNELKERTATILKENKDQVLLSQRLATIRTDLDIELDLKKAEVENFDFSKVVDLFNELDFKSLLTKLPQNTKGEQASLFGATAEEVKWQPSTAHESVTTIERWQQIQPELLKQEMFAVDTETITFNDDIIGVSFAWGQVGSEKSCYLVLSPAYPGGVDIEKVRESLSEVLLGDAKKIGHNIKYDLHALKRAGFRVKNVYFDTMLASQLINSQLFSHGIDDLAFSLLGFKKLKTTELLGKNKLMTDVGLDQLSAYACEDAVITWRLFHKFYKDTQEKDVKRIFYELEMPLIPVLVRMEREGIKIDKDYLKKLEDKLRSRLKTIEAEAHKVIGEAFNLASPSQLQEILFNKLKLSVVGIKKIKSGYSTDADSLAKLAGKHPVIDLILEYRELSKLMNTYIETLPEQADANSRIHTSFLQLGAATGRMASTNPNLQNIPIRTELGNEVRRAFVAEKCKLLLGADYSQAELRVLAHLSEDPLLINAFINESDFHAAVAKQLGVDRRAAKAINFGIIYGLGASALANDIGISTQEARAFIDKYFETFPGVAKFIENQKKKARELGYSETLFGRKRYLPDIHSPNMMLRAAAERIAVNMPNQGTVADLMKMSMIEIDKLLPENAKMLLQIHDELLFEVDKGAENEIGALVKDVMGNIAQLKVPLIVDIKLGPNWAELEKI